MKKVIVLAAVAAGCLVFGAGAASAYTHAQQDAMLDALKAKLNCLRKTPVSEFYPYATWSSQVDAGGNPIGPNANVNDDPDLDSLGADNDVLVDQGWSFALDWDFGNSTPDYWIVTVKNTSSCRSKYSTTPTPPWWGRATVAERLTRARQLDRVQ
jgi:hypothetical protein